MSNIILGSDGIAIRQGIYEESLVAKTDLGRFIDFQDGRRFRYCQAATVAITRAHLITPAAVVANDNTVTQTGMTVAISGGSIGSKIVKVLLGGATTKNLYAEGYLTIEGGTGLGFCYKIKSNKAGGAAVATPCELTLYDPIVVALDATTILTLTQNRYRDVIVAPATTVVSPILGVPLIDIAADYYFWCQTRGYAPVVVDDDGALVVGMGVSSGGGDAGAALAEAAALVSQRIGIAVQVAAQDTYATIDLKCE